EGEFRERSHGNPAWTFRQVRFGFFSPGRTRNIDVRPWQPAGELLQEESRRNRTAGAAAGVGKVGDLALQLLAVFVEQRHRPHAIARAIGYAADVRHPVV